MDSSTQKCVTSQKAHISVTDNAHLETHNLKNNKVSTNSGQKITSIKSKYKTDAPTKTTVDNKSNMATSRTKNNNFGDYRQGNFLFKN